MHVREAFLKRANHRKLAPYKMEDIDGVFIRSMSKGTRSRIESLASGSKSAKDCSEIRWIVIRDCFVDEEGDSILKREDKSSFDAWDDSLIEPMFNAIMEISNVNDDDRAAFEKN